MIEDAAGRALRRRIRQEHRGQEKHHRQRTGRLGNHTALLAGAELGLAGAAEHRADVRAFALLQQDHDGQRDADQDVNRDDQRVHLLLRPTGLQTIRALTIRANESAFKLAPPTKAPSISGLETNESTLSVVTLPPYRMRTSWAASRP